MAKTSRIYPPWWEETLTIYNKYEDKLTNIVTWYRTVVQGCFWKYTGNKILVGDTLLETNTTICRIRYNDKFMQKYVWEHLPNDQMSQYFTLGPDDIIVKGEVSDEIDEYTAGHRSSDLLSKYKRLQGCITVEQVGINTGTMRCSEHYYVRGT